MFTYQRLCGLSSRIAVLAQFVNLYVFGMDIPDHFLNNQINPDLKLPPSQFVSGSHGLLCSLDSLPPELHLVRGARRTVTGISRTYTVSLRLRGCRSRSRRYFFEAPHGYGRLSVRLKTAV